MVVRENYFGWGGGYLRVRGFRMKISERVVIKFECFCC